ncbi:SDR family NAD(P)-dependent oxidoreductase [Thalassobaculum sp.]|uniref:SDR family NAD(P)-dependent oxidoreductase n=1 Tax=Thalassobaculum sp. TaxID=2022740 RepID=UPI0032EBE83C
MTDQEQAAAGPAPWPPGGVAVVFGAGGGIGSALLERLRAGGAFATVLGFGRATEPAIDLLDEASLKHAVEAAAAHGDIRLAIDATGFLHDDQAMPEKSWRELDGDRLSHAFAVNAVGPALLMKHLLPRLPRRGRAVFATLSARVGSIADNRLGGWYGYRASKAALNQLVRTAAVELRRTRPDAVCVALHPGTVDTGLSRPFARTGLEAQPPALAAERLLTVVDGLTVAGSGGFFDHRGTPVPW